MNPKHILIWSDSPSGSSGLARITRDIATRIATLLPEFKVSTIGYGAPGSRKLPFQQYAWSKGDDWVVSELPQVWEDFTEGEDGIFFPVYDAARCYWLGQPDNPEFKMNPICQWVGKMRAKGKMKTWIYCPIDAAGPHGKLAYPLKQTVLGFDRVLTYSAWANGILKHSGIANTDWLPHGINENVWCPRPVKRKPDEYRIGIVATNQTRKDWALGIQAAAILRDKYKKNVTLWLHTDVFQRFWDIPALLIDYGFICPTKDTVSLTESGIHSKRTWISTGDLTDEQMATQYSLCDVTLGIGRGEGFGYPILESLACGTPVCAHAYSGYAEWLPDWMQVAPEMYHYEGLYCEARPIGVPEVWADHIAQYSSDFTGIELPKQLEWMTLWPRWAEWLRKGLK